MREVTEETVPHVLDIGIKVWRQPIPHLLGDDDFSWSSQCHEPRCEVYTASKNIIMYYYYVCQLHTHTEQNALVVREPDVSQRTYVLDLKSGRYCRSNFGEIQKHSITEALNKSSAMAGENICSHLLDEVEPTRDNPTLILLDEAHRFCDIDQQYRTVSPCYVTTRTRLCMIRSGH
jgi:hypothetical protein